MRVLAFLLVFLVSACSSLSPRRVDGTRDHHTPFPLETVVALVNPETGRPYCTGVITAEGVLTAAHCVGDSTVVNVGMFGDVDFTTKLWGRSFMVPVLRTSEACDLALVGLPPSSPSPAELADREPRLTETVRVVGMPLGNVYSVHEGIVSGFMRHGNEYQPRYWFQIDAGVYPGNSGGPVFSADGEVLGIVSFGATQSGIFTGTLGMAVPVFNREACW